jgi:hypothetical protein
MRVHGSGRLLARALFAGKKIESLLLNNNMLGGDGAGTEISCALVLEYLT